MRATDIPAVRDQIRNWTQTELAHLIWRKAAREGQYRWLETNGPADLNVSDYHNPSEDDLNEIAWLMRSALHQGMNDAVLFWVSQDMGRLSAAASQTVPGFLLEPHDLPAPSGLMVFETPPLHRTSEDGTLGVHALSWWTVPSKGQTICTAYTSHTEMGPLLKAKGAHRYETFHTEPPLIPLIGLEIGWGFGIDTSVAEILELGGDDAGAINGAAAMALLKTAWLLMQQEITISTTKRPDRAARRRAEREHTEPSPVRLITLRRRKAQPGQREDDEREFHHQWIVRGHWRSQWYPSRHVHRPVWVTPYIKGPEGAPMLGGEKVNAWVR